MRFFLALNRCCFCCFTDFLPRPQPPIEAIPKPPLSVELGHLCLESAGRRPMLGLGWGHRSLPGRADGELPPWHPQRGFGTLLRCWGSDCHHVLCVPAPWPCSTSNSPAATTAGDPRPLHVFIFGASSRGWGCLERPSERRGRWRPPALTPSAGGCGTSPALPQRC